MDEKAPLRYSPSQIPLTVHIHTSDIEIKDANSGRERSKLTIYVEVGIEVIAAVQVDEWEIGRLFAEYRGGWRPVDPIWRRLGDGEWETDRTETPRPTRAQHRRATIEPHLALIGDAMQAHGLDHPYSGRGRKRKLDANQAAHLKEAGESDSSIAQRLGVDVTTVWKQRKRAAIHASRHEAQATSDSIEEPADDKPSIELPTKKELSKVVETLSYPESSAIKKRYGLGGEDPWTLDRVSMEYGVTAERIGEIESQFAGK